MGEINFSVFGYYFSEHHFSRLYVLGSRDASEAGAAQVKVTYANEKPPILTCLDAIKAKSFFPAVPDLTIGDAPTAIKNAPHTVEGSLEIGSQFHFHMETQVLVLSVLSNLYETTFASHIGFSARTENSSASVSRSWLTRKH